MSWPLAKSCNQRELHHSKNRIRWLFYYPKYTLRPPVHQRPAMYHLVSKIQPNNHFPLGRYKWIHKQCTFKYQWNAKETTKQGVYTYGIIWKIKWTLIQVFFLEYTTVLFLIRISFRTAKWIICVYLSNIRLFCPILGVNVLKSITPRKKTLCVYWQALWECSTLVIQSIFPVPLFILSSRGIFPTSEGKTLGLLSFLGRQERQLCCVFFFF